jgi:ribosomal protein L16/L10AE
MPEITSQQIEAARKALADALQQRDKLLQQRAASRAVASSAARRLEPDDGRLRELNNAAEQANRNWQESHDAVTSRQNALQNLVAQFVGQAGDGDFRALSTRYPIALFPVRIETRFLVITDNPRLQIRVYPDEILADSHEPSLTQQEIDAGHVYWTASWPNGEVLEAWQTLISTRTAQRAAWIAIQTQPTNWATRPAGIPVFKDPPLRPHVWTRGVEARALPDRWIAQAYRGGNLIHQAISAAIVEPLVLTLNPNANPADKVEPYDDGFTIAKELQWTIDFEAARAVGMAFEMAIEPSEIQLGFDRLLVFGVKPSASPDANATSLSDLLDNHHYTRGLAFVKQGTPTNNTSGQLSGFPPPDPNGAISFAVERNDQKLTADSDGVRFMRALGLGPDAAAHLANAGITEQVPAQAMNHALFPVTMGYFLEQMMSPQFGVEVANAAREFFQNYIRARGSLPAFRVGAVPYGILPVSSLNGWLPDRETSSAEHNLPDLLRHLLPYWLSAVNQAPHVGQTNDPDGDMAKILAMEASAREVWVRSFAGKTLVANAIAMFGILPQTVFLEVQALITANVLASLGHPEWIVRAMELMNLKDATQFRYSFVTDKPLSETDPLPDAGNYIAQLASATTVDQILAGYNDKEPTALLYQLLRHALLRENDRVVFNALVDYKLATTSQRIEPELTGVATIAATSTTWQRMATVVPAISSKFLADAALSERAAFNTAMTSYQEALVSCRSCRLPNWTGC